MLIRYYQPYSGRGRMIYAISPRCLVPANLSEMTPINLRQGFYTYVINRL
jgi:hypothetical protein